MSGNTGFKKFANLQLYYPDNGESLNVTKVNVSTDPDYIAPVYDIVSCPVGTPGFGNGFNSVVYCIEVLSMMMVQDNDDKLVIGGSFTTYQGLTQNKIVRLNRDGSKDTSFDIGTGFDGGHVYDTATLPDGTIYVVGSFTTYKGVSENGIIKLLANGTKDTSFNTGTGFNAYGGSTVTIQPDGKLIVTGSFTTYQGSSYSKIIRLNTNGTIDTSFVVGTGFNINNVSSVVLRTDGSLICGGQFTIYNGISANAVVVLTSLGAIDTSFVYGSGFNSSSRAALDGTNIFFAGSFNTYKSVTSNFVVKTNSVGTVDTSFNIGTGFDNTVYQLYPQNDGNVLAIGHFTTYKGVSEPKIMRLLANGNKDSTFTPGSGFNNTAHKVVRQSIGSNAGKYVIIGEFTTYNGIISNRIVRLNSDGSRDI
jgi:uncharacterized delta-60 repeat protein